MYLLSRINSIKLYTVVIQINYSIHYYTLQGTVLNIAEIILQKCEMTHFQAA